MSKPVILTGLRANNDLHIGNYLGALLPLIDMANTRAGDYQINLFVPDLHSFTTPVDHNRLQESIMQNLRVFVAAGLPLDKDDIYLYRQSYIPAHSELCVLLNNFTYFGELSRMTQFKDKVASKKGDAQTVVEVINSGLGEAPRTDEFLDYVSGQNISAGFFDYPVLMAADILLYGATYVPVGEDQTQHLELTRDVATRMNLKFNQELFILPKPVKEQHDFFGKDQGLRIRDLQNPSKKMSKSDESGNGVIFLTDAPAVARKKIMAAETDSFGEIQYDYDRRPGISNLLDILGLFGGDKDGFIGQSQYGPLKSAVADKIIDFLTTFQAVLSSVNDDEIIHKLEASEMLMHQVSAQRLHKVQQAVGLRPR